MTTQATPKFKTAIPNYGEVQFSFRGNEQHSLSEIGAEKNDPLVQEAVKQINALGAMCQTRAFAFTMDGAIATDKAFGGKLKFANTSFDDRLIAFVASDDDEDRDGDRIFQDGWEFDNFKQNPVFLWGHDSRVTPAIGRVEDFEVVTEGGVDQLCILVRFATQETHPFADTIFRLYRDGILNSVSVGFWPKEIVFVLNEDGFISGMDFVKQELLEVSAVNIPANPRANIIRALEAKNFSGEEMNQAVKLMGLDESIDVGAVSRDRFKGAAILSSDDQKDVDVSEAKDTATNDSIDGSARFPLPSSDIGGELFDKYRKCKAHDGNCQRPALEGGLCRMHGGIPFNETGKELLADAVIRLMTGILKTKGVSSEAIERNLAPVEGVSFMVDDGERIFVSLAELHSLNEALKGFHQEPKGEPATGLGRTVNDIEVKVFAEEFVPKADHEALQAAYDQLAANYKELEAENQLAVTVAESAAEAIEHLRPGRGEESVR